MTVIDNRRGHTTVNTKLDGLLETTQELSTDELAALIAADQIIGHPETEDTPSSHPVGLWVLGQLQATGTPAVSYTWVSTLSVYDTNQHLIGQVCVPEGHPLGELVFEVNDLGRPELLQQGEGDRS